MRERQQNDGNIRFGDLSVGQHFFFDGVEYTKINDCEGKICRKNGSVTGFSSNFRVWMVN